MSNENSNTDENHDDVDKRITASLSDPSTWIEPPQHLREQVIAAALAAKSKPAPASTPLRTWSNGRQSSGRWKPTWQSSVLAAAAAFLLVVVGVQIRSPKARVDASAKLVAIPAAAGATGTVHMKETNSGWEFRLNTTGLPRLDKPLYYQAWITGDKGNIPIGTFHTGIDVILWGGVELDEYPTVIITKEREDNNPAPSSELILSGPVKFYKTEKERS